MDVTFTTAAGTVASLSSFQAAPQAWRAIRHSVIGISVTTWSMLTFQSGIWVSYGAVFGIGGEIAGNVILIIGAGLILLGCARHGVSVRRQAIAIAIGWAIVLGTFVPLKNFLGAAAVAAGVGCFIPQAIIRNEDLQGVSVTAWIWMLIGTLAWLAYGLALHNIPVWLPNVVATPMAVVVIVRASLSHHRRKTLPAPA